MYRCGEVGVSLHAIASDRRKRLKTHRSMVCFGMVLLGWPLGLLSQAPLPDSVQVEQRTDAIVSKLTLEQKLELIGGEGYMTTHPEPSAEFPRLKLADGPLGVRIYGPSTAYAAGIALAATWDPDLAYKVGVALGQDSRAHGVNFLLGPGVNIYRAPMNGRNFEYSGEDPYLTSRMVVKYIEGVQSQGVSATVKHFLANNSEYDRHNLSSDIDERTLREIYLPSFEAAIKEAHVGALMDSYNLINGVHASQNGALNNEIVKKEWGFDGVIMSDWASTYDGVAAANGGLDLEMPFAKAMSAAVLLPAIAQGRVQVATIDDKVRRIVRTAVRFGWLDRPQEDRSISLYNENGRGVALQEALESIVLLKNDKSLLPLDSKTICSIAVIGPNAWPAVSGGGGSSHTTPFTEISTLDGIAEEMQTLTTGGGKPACPGVLYDRGLATQDDLYKQTEFVSEGSPGLKQQVFANAEFSGKPLSEMQVKHLSLQAIARPDGPSRISVRWTGDYLPAKTGKYSILAYTGMSGTYRLQLNGKQVIDQILQERNGPRWVEVDAVAGQPIHIEMDYVPVREGVVQGALAIAPTEDLVSARAKAFAASSDVVVLSVGFDMNTEAEEMDRTFALPWGQEQLIRTVAALNKKTIVLVNAGGNVDMQPWMAQVSGVFHLWYPGQEGGRAIADLLFGKANPEGRLPVSFEKSWADNPVHGSYYPTSGAETSQPHVQYSEGVFLGYRYYAGSTVKPQFAFGFGLSYTSFAFSHLVVTPTTAVAGDEVNVAFDVTNTGKTFGGEVAQVYVGDPSATVKRPVEELKGFQKVHLNPGETQHLEFRLNRRSFAYWSTEKHDWSIDPGRFTVMVGDASDHLPLQTGITLR
jgi:beta-glucosidase